MEKSQTQDVGEMSGVAGDISLLVAAVQDGNQEVIEQMLQAGFNINEPQSYGPTPIVESKNGAVAQFLISRGADVNCVTNSSARTPLIYVLNKLSKYQFMFRSNESIREVILVLLENGACVNARTSNGRTPLMLAAAIHGQVKVLQMLLDHGADFTDRDNKGNTALMHALTPDAEDNAEFLLQLMENTDLLNVQNNRGLTALMYGVLHCDWGIACQLIHSGADVNITDVNGNTALFRVISTYLPDKLLVNLIKAGCSVNHQNNAGLSPLMHAVRQHNYTGAVPLLLGLGADVNTVNQKDTSKTALSYFTYNLDTEAVACLETLLDRGADAAYLSPCCLSTVICLCPYKLIPKLIRCGLAPFNVNFDEMPRRLQDSFLSLSSVSPICLALLKGNATLASYFWENLFLTNVDLFLVSNNHVRQFLQEKMREECASFLDEIGSQPMSLSRMCFVTVSSVVGASPGREARVHQLPLPRALKEMLLFKSEVVNLAQPEGRDGNLNDYFQTEYSEEDEYSEDDDRFRRIHFRTMSRRQKRIKEYRVSENDLSDDC